MTLDQFAAKLRGYFNAVYPPGQAEIVGEWFSEIPPHLLDDLFREVIRLDLYGKPLPLIADLEKALAKAKDRWAESEGRRKAETALEDLRPEENTLEREEVAMRLGEMFATVLEAKKFSA